MYVLVHMVFSRFMLNAMIVVISMLVYIFIIRIYATLPSRMHVIAIIIIHIFSSTKPKPKEKEYIVQFIGKNRWRLPGSDKTAAMPSSSEDQGKTEEELQLDREAAEAVLKGKRLLHSLFLTCIVSLSLFCCKWALTAVMFMQLCVSVKS